MHYITYVKSTLSLGPVKMVVSVEIDSAKLGAWFWVGAGVLSAALSVAGGAALAWFC